MFVTASATSIRMCISCWHPMVYSQGSHEQTHFALSCYVIDIMHTNYISIKIDIEFKLMWTIPILKVWMGKHYQVSCGIWSTPKVDGRHLDTFHP